MPVSLDEEQGLLRSEGDNTKKIIAKLIPKRKCCGKKIYSYHDISSDAEQSANDLVAFLSEKAPDTIDARVQYHLSTVWTNVYHTPCPAIPGREWRELGFQSNNPISDLRAAGMAGLTFMSRASAENDVAILAADGTSGFPFAIASINILYALCMHLQLVDKLPGHCPCCSTHIRKEYTEKQPHNGKYIKAFGLLMDDPDALFLLYVSTLLKAGAIWRKRFASNTKRNKPNPLLVASAVEGDPRLLEWPAVLKETIDSVLRALKTMPTDMKHLDRVLRK
jgi:ELMO/CED-12 family